MLSNFLIYAQKETITGMVSDESGPLPGVSVLIKGTTTGTETDFDGKYSIEAEIGDVLVFSFVGLSLYLALSSVRRGWIFCIPFIDL